MFRILTASQDTYITDKVLYGSRSITSNVGAAASLDLFKLHDESFLSGTADPVELSRILVKFNYDNLQAITGTVLDASGSNFKAFLHLKNIYGGQTTPSNFSLQVHPLAKAWDEGVGFDVYSYRDVDATNWITASINPTLSLWTVTGAFQSGSIGDTCDYFVSGNIGAGSQSLGLTQTFTRGDEDLYVDVSSLVSASVWGNLPNNGFRIAFINSQETDTTTRFVKRFGSKDVNNQAFRPQMYIKYDGNVVSDDLNLATFDVANRFYLYNAPRGIDTNLRSGSSTISGANCLKLELHASKSGFISVTTWSQSHSASITYTTTSITYFSASFSGSQKFFGRLAQTGVYYSDVTMDTFSTASLNTYASGTGYNVPFLMLWKSLDNSYLYTSGTYVTFTKDGLTNAAFSQRNYVINITNLEQFYTREEKTRLRVYVQDWEFSFATLKVPKPAVSKILKTMYWRLIDPFTKEVVIPFDSIGTKLSSDGEGMFFDFWFQDLDINRVYEFEFKIDENNRVDNFFEQGFRFKVLKE